MSAAGAPVGDWLQALSDAAPQVGDSRGGAVEPVFAPIRLSGMTAQALALQLKSGTGVGMIPGSNGGLAQKNNTDDGQSLCTDLDAARLGARLGALAYMARLYDGEADAPFLALGLGEVQFADMTARQAPLMCLPVAIEFAADGSPVLRGAERTLMINPEALAGLSEAGRARTSGASVEVVFAEFAAAYGDNPDLSVTPGSCHLGLFGARWTMITLTGRLLSVPPDRRGAYPLLEILAGGAEAQGGDDDEPIMAPSEPVLAADLRQRLALAAVERGENTLISTPPGGGRTRLIVNLLTNAVRQGKRVLLATNRPEALEPVAARLATLGLGGLVTERRPDGEFVSATEDAAAPPADPWHAAALQQIESELNEHIALLHASTVDGRSAYDIIGRAALARSGAPAGFDLPEAAGQSTDEMQQRLEAADVYARAIAAAANPAGRHWRGTGLASVSPDDVIRLRHLIGRVEADLLTLTEVNQDLATRNLAEPAVLIGDFDTLTRVLRASSAVPAGDWSALSERTWRTDLTAISDLVALGGSWTRLRARVDASFRPEIWNTDLESVRETVDRYGERMARQLSSAWREGRQRLEALALVALPADYRRQLSLIDGLIAAQETRRQFEEGRGLGQRAFGAGWRDEGSDWAALQLQIDWWREHRHPSLPDAELERLAGHGPVTDLSHMIAVVTQEVRRLRQDLEEITAFLALDVEEAFGFASWSEMPLETLRQRVSEWAGALPEFSGFTGLAAARQRMIDLGLGLAVTAIEEGRQEGATLVASLERAVAEADLATLLARSPTLGQFDGRRFERRVASYLDLEAWRMTTALYEVKTAAAGAGERPIMLTPIAGLVLDPGAAPAYDLAILEEAHGLNALTALPALMRGRQLALIGEAPLTEANLPTAGTEDAASSLADLAQRRGFSRFDLTGHYRSRHPALIETVNRVVYAGRLAAAPSPLRGTAQAVRLAPCDEEDFVAAAIELTSEYGRAEPQRSLALVAVTGEQALKLSEALEEAGRSRPEIAALLARPDEPLLALPASMAQGLVRDCVIAVAPYTGGSLVDFAAFLADDDDHGKWRIATLLTRARWRCTVLSGLSLTDIAAVQAEGGGLALFTAYLTDMADAPAAGPADALQRLVAEKLADAGFMTERPAGAAMFGLELAVVDPDQPELYRLGLVFDGPGYATLADARERETMNAAVLAARGWMVHRVFALEWLLQPVAALDRLMTAVQMAGQKEPQGPALLWKERRYAPASAAPSEGVRAAVLNAWAAELTGEAPPAPNEGG